MGNFYTNIVTKGVPSGVLHAIVSSEPFASIVAPDVDGHSFVYGDFFGSGDSDAPARLAKTLSEAEGAEFALVSMNADDDLFIYQIWHAGARVDAYFSNPDAFEPNDLDAERPQGDPSRLQSLFPFIDAQAIRDVLDNAAYIFEFERHQDLFRLLHIPTGPAVADFEYLQNGEIPEGLDASRLIRIAP